MIKRALFLIAICGCTLAFAQSPAPASAPAATTTPSASVAATPALWQVKGTHGTVYLFGSVHVMKPNVDWETPKVKAALTSADVIYLEIANIDDTASAQPLMMQYGLDTAHPLSSKMSKEDIALLDSTLKSMGMPGEQMFEMMQPWLVAASLEVLPMLKDGYAPTSGFDMKLLAETKGAQKPVKGFETMEDQVHLMADVPQAEQVELLHKQLTELDKSAAQMNDIVDAWQRGDVEKIGQIDNDELALKHPAEYKRMVVDRNRKWAAILDTLLKDPTTGTVFVAVGAAHLAGPDSVLKMLEQSGYKVVRQ